MDAKSLHMYTSESSQHLRTSHGNLSCSWRAWMMEGGHRQSLYHELMIGPLFSARKALIYVYTDLTIFPFKRKKSSKLRDSLLSTWCFYLLRKTSNGLSVMVSWISKNRGIYVRKSKKSTCSFPFSVNLSIMMSSCSYEPCMSHF